MLYWGEGWKSLNTVKFTNSDLDMLFTFHREMKKFFPDIADKASFRIQCYTDLHLLDEIENYWKKNLNIGKMTKSSVNKISKASKNKRNKKLEWGTVSMNYHNSETLYKIYGGIKFFSNNNEYINLY